MDTLPLIQPPAPSLTTSSRPFTPYSLPLEPLTPNLTPDPLPMSPYP
ncbi:hypothetical protein E2C01_067548 [Portunus trituberculatus]|uniref:Uncharacterized protein n=1 Tax=Portunus trituberculatus TaxID=210409 RepID=A0A5B7HU23_PORTR|nr:hypothetical protein [Portunus trituberculatus]